MSEVPSEVQEFAAKQMLQTIYGERAKFKVQKITNGHNDSDVCGEQRQDLCSEGR